MSGIVTQNDFLIKSSQFGIFQLNKVDVNEVTQYALIKKAIERNGNNASAFDPPSGVGFAFNYLYYLNSANESHSESTNEIMNYFLSKKYSQTILDTSNKEISSLLSFVKFSRIIKVNNKPDFKKITEIPFSTHYTKNSLNSILQDSTGCGLSSLKVDVISNTGAYYAYKVSISLYFANASVLANDSKYHSLLTTPTKDPNKNPIVYSLIFGWATPTFEDSVVNSGSDLYEEKTCLLVNLTNYELGVNEDGSVSLKLNFIGAAETEANALTSDVLIHRFDFEEQIKNLQQIIDNAIKGKEEEEKIIIEKQKQLQTEVSNLYNKKEATSDSATKQKIESEIQRINKALEGANDYSQTPTGEGEAQKADPFWRSKSFVNQFDSIIKTNQEKIDSLRYTIIMKRMFDNGCVYQGKVNFKATQQDSFIVFEPMDITGTPTSAVATSTIDWGTTQNTIDKIIKFRDKNKSSDLTQAEKELVEQFTEVNRGSLVKGFRYRSPTEILQEEGSVEYGTIYFKYFLLGDLISTIVDCMYSNMASSKTDLSPQENIKVVLATLDIIQEQYLGQQLTENKKITMDLAYFPISYNFFVSWFFNNVITKDVKSFPFNQFIKDFMNNCVLKIIQDYGTWDKKFSKLIDKQYNFTSVLKTSEDEGIEIAYLDLPYRIEDATTSKTTEIVPTDIKSIFQNAKDRKKISAFVDENTLGKPFYKYAFIYGKFGKTSRNGDYKENLKNGIFHFFVGSTTGILKEIKFIPINNPSRYTAQVQNNLGDKNGKPYNEKFNVIQRYDVNISCVGFPYFKPGQIIFIDTSLLGFGKPSQARSIAHEFNLGGYYLITNVSHDFQVNDFTTSLVAKFLDYGKGS